MLKLLGLIVGVVLLMPVPGFATDYDVTAKVPAPMPSSLPLIDGPANDTVQELPTVFITGTCEIVVPNIVVVLVRSGEVIGTGNCSPQGTFRILVSLVLGVNIIIPQFTTITGDFSGFGAPLSLTYAPKKNQTTNEKKDPIVVEDDSGTAAGLKLDFDYNFVTYNTETITKISYGVYGGKAPYNVVISWGDETETRKKIAISGLNEAQHQYRSILPSSTIAVVVTDARGDKVVQTRALVSFRKGEYIPPAQPVVSSGRSMVAVWLVGAFTATILLLYHYARHTKVSYFRSKNRPVKTAKKMIKK